MPASAVFELLNALTYLIFEMGWKSSVILSFVLLVNKFLKRQPSSLRQSIYSTAILTIIILTVIAPIFPRWNLFLPTWISANILTKPVNEVTLAKDSPNPKIPAGERNSDIKADAIIDNQSHKSYNSPAVTSINFMTVMMNLALFIWLTFAVVLLRRLWKSLFGLRFFRRDPSSIQASTGLNLLVEDISRKFGCDQRIAVLRHEAIKIPVTWGILRHFVLLPKDFEELSAECQRAVLTHELSHIKRLDFVIRALTEILCAVLWFQPLVWIVRRKLWEEQERAADDYVLAMGGKPSAYAKLLLEWNERLRGNNRLLVVAPGMIEKSSFALRINAILDPNLKRRSTRIPEIMIVWLVTLSLAIPLTRLAFSGEMLPDEEILIDTVTRPEKFPAAADEKLTRSSGELTLPNSSSNEKAEKNAKRKLPNNAAFLITNRSEESIVANQKLKNERKEIKNEDRASATVSDSILQSKASIDNPSAMIKVPSDDQEPEIKPSPAAMEASEGKAHKMVRQVFENIRQGFKNSKKPVNIFDP